MTTPPPRLVLSFIAADQSEVTRVASELADMLVRCFATGRNAVLVTRARGAWAWFCTPCRVRRGLTTWQLLDVPHDRDAVLLHLALFGETLFRGEPASKTWICIGDADAATLTDAVRRRAMHPEPDLGEHCDALIATVDWCPAVAAKACLKGVLFERSSRLRLVGGDEVETWGFLELDWEWVE